jgi:hypothetical protein
LGSHATLVVGMLPAPPLPAAATAPPAPAAIDVAPPVAPAALGLPAVDAFVPAAALPVEPAEPLGAVVVAPPFPLLLLTVLVGAGAPAVAPIGCELLLQATATSCATSGMMQSTTGRVA